MKSRSVLNLSTTMALLLLAMRTNYSQQKEKIPVDRDFDPSVTMANYKPADWCRGYQNQPCPSDFRILDCWQCFQAQGKVCMDETHNSLHHHLETSLSGVVFCCKQDYNGDHCEDGSVHGDKSTGEDVKMICSPNSFGTTPGFSNVMTGNRNYQMFAYCPTINQAKCGFPNHKEGSTDMKIRAGKDKAEIQAHKLHYLPPGPKKDGSGFIGRAEAEYDACYYEVIVDPALREDWLPTKLHVKITEKSAPLNAYVYGGKSRKEATKSLVAGNAQVEVGQTFSVSPDEGILIVAYPNDEQEDEFYFEYWVDVTAKPPPGTESQINTVVQEPEPEIESKSLLDKITEEQDLTFIILCAAAGCILLTIIFLCVYWKCRNKKKIDPGMQPESDIIDLGAAGYAHTNKESMELEELEEEVGGVNSMLDNEGTNRQTSTNKINGGSPPSLDNKKSPKIITQKYPGMKDQGTADDSWG